MDIKKLQRTIVDALEDVKAQDIVVYNTIGMTELFDRVILATASSNRQTRALASRVGEKVKAAGGQVISTEGLDTGEWVLVDLGDAVVHIMQPAIRAYYKLEEIWGGKPVRMVLGGGRAARPAAEPEAEPQADEPEAPAPAAKKAPARKSAAKAPAKSAGPTRAGKTAKSAKTAAGAVPRRAAAKKSAKKAAKKATKSAAPRARKTATKRAR